MAIVFDKGNGDIIILLEKKKDEFAKLLKNANFTEKVEYYKTWNV